MIAPQTRNILPIDFLQADEDADVVQLVGDELQVRRLAEMGLRVGTNIRMVRPGAPCVLAVDGKRLSIRLGTDVDVMVATA